MSTITLLTDFGLEDAWVGIMKGVILGINSEARIVDITHQIPPQDTAAAAWMIAAAYPYFPGGSVHVVVVGPAVEFENLVRMDLPQPGLTSRGKLPECRSGAGHNPGRPGASVQRRLISIEGSKPSQSERFFDKRSN